MSSRNLRIEDVEYNVLPWYNRTSMRHLAHNTAVDEMGTGPEDKVMLQVPGILRWQIRELMRRLVEKNKGLQKLHKHILKRGQKILLRHNYGAASG